MQQEKEKKSVKFANINDYINAAILLSDNTHTHTHTK